MSLNCIIYPVQFKKKYVRFTVSSKIVIFKDENYNKHEMEGGGTMKIVKNCVAKYYDGVT